MTGLSATIGAAVVLVSAGAADGHVVVFTFSLDGSQEVPGNGSPGTGTAVVVLDLDDNTVSATGTFQGLLGDVTGAHLHGPGDVGENAPILVPLAAIGGTSGTFAGGGVLTVEQVTEMLNGFTYLNVHSAVFPGGEIRGQVVPVPGALAVLGMAGLAVERRRR